MVTSSARHAGVFALVSATLVSACGPIPLARAEKECFQRARLAVQPRGEISGGITSNGPAAGFEIEVSSDFIQGRDPAQVYDACVFQKSGLPPSQPLYSRTDWKG